MAKTASGLVAYCKAQLGLPYWMGTFGQIATAALYKSNKARLPAYYTASDFPSQYGKRVHDCVGLIKGYRWSATPTSAPVYNASQDVPVSGLYAQCSKRGAIKTMPKVPGTCVFMSGHVGVYVGGGYVIEARGHAYGVVKTKLSDRPWVNWGQPSWLTYDTKADTTSVERRGIDVSYSNETINWKKVKDAGIQFAMIRIGRGDTYRTGQMHADSQAEANINGAKANGILIGYYWFSYAATVAEAKKEADFCCDLIKKFGVEPDYPVAFDYEYDSEKKVPPKDNIVDMARAFLTRIKERGYWPANYTNDDFLKRGFSKLTGEFDLWLAEWNNNAKPSRNCGIWQYRSTGKVDGIYAPNGGRVDLDWSYTDYPTLIKKGETSSNTNTSEIVSNKEDYCEVQCEVLKNGSSGSTVRSWQTLLNYWGERTGKGYSCGTVDGQFGSRTEAATRKFQTTYGITADGIVGSKTWEMMLS